MKQNLAGVVIFGLLWAFFSGLAIHLCPEAGVADCMVAGAVFAALSTLPLAFVCGLFVCAFSAIWSVSSPKSPPQ